MSCGDPFIDYTQPLSTYFSSRLFPFQCSLLKVRHLGPVSEEFLALARWGRRLSVADEDDDGHDECDGQRDEPDDVEDGDVVGAEGAYSCDVCNV